MNNAFDVITSRMDTAEEKISHLEDMLIETSQNEMKRQKRKEECRAIFKTYGKIMKDVKYISWKFQKRERDRRNIWKNNAQAFFKINDRHQTADNNKLWKILKEMGVPDHLTVSLRKLHADQEATIRTGHGTTDWFKVGKQVQ